MPSKPPALYPAYLNVAGARVLVVGGGPVAARKAAELLRCGARVHAVAKSFDPAFRGWTAKQGLKKSKRAYRAADLRGARLVFACTDDAALNAKIAAAAQKQGAWVNVATPPEAGDLVAPAVARKGPWSVAVSTGGASAAAAKTLRKELERYLDGAWTQFLTLLESRRDRVKKVVPDPAKRRRLLRQLGDACWVEMIRREGRAETVKKMDWMIEQARKKATPRKAANR